ncbi:ferritin-like domain-containing protein [Mycobacterium sp.]|uniref:ferritin-like domain-containing protein n=1 Tax=Mycobacterium sp. TaxID=1785 RepID=UPI002CE74D14|nr:ferritin-like domain-containing protein [Mycobacterium sp.]HKP40246.1 ferritin-like domain-containing protein [Mycobacterium sp.]
MTSPQPTPSTTTTTTTTTTTATTTTASSRAAEPTSPSRPQDGANGALFDAIATEHATIYGYGLVSAHSTPDVNDLVSAAMAEHRERREAAIEMLDSRSVDAPLPAAGYQSPIEVDNPTDAANLAVRMEEDAAVAWRAVVEQATDAQDRAFAVTALTQCAVAAARWSRVLGVTPITVAFPGGSE